MKRIIMHIDVNNAFLSWTAVDLLKKGFEKDIRNFPSVIGGDPSKRKGIVLAKSTLAKSYGIVTGETLYSANKKCPNMEVYKGNYKLYEEMSNKFINLLKKYTPDIEQLSIDECFIDYTKVKSLYGNELLFAKKIQEEIFNELGFTVNIGIANNKLCAKMASDFSKPNKIHTLYDEEIQIKMWPLDVGELYGIGKKTLIVLNQIGIKSIKDLANSNVEFLYKYFKNQSKDMIDAANGIDYSEVDNSYNTPKGIGNEITLEKDIYDKKELCNYLLKLSDFVSKRLRKLNKYAFTISLVIKDSNFKRINKQKTLTNPTNNSKEIFEISKKILFELDIEDVRLIGIRLDNLTDISAKQISLFESIEEKKGDEDLDKVVDKLKDKYGNSIIKKASLANSKDLRME